MKEIKLTKGKIALVDDEDYEELNKIKWYPIKSSNTFYAIGNDYSGAKNKPKSMHTMIMKTPKGMYTDHIDHNGLNNQKSNLRIVTSRQNSQNRNIKKTSKYIGVHWNKELNKWVSQININQELKSIGCFENELDAHNAYLNKLKEIGEVFIDDIYQIKELNNEI
jgi:hypothetical protein